MGTGLGSSGSDGSTICVSGKGHPAVPRSGVSLPFRMFYPIADLPHFPGHVLSGSACHE